MNSYTLAYRVILSYAMLWENLIAGINTNGYASATSYASWHVTTIKDAIELQSNSIGERAWFSYGYVGAGVTYGGISGLARNWLVDMHWYIATYTRDAISIKNNLIVITAWMHYGGLSTSHELFGLCSLDANSSLTYIGLVATISIRCYVCSS